MPEIRLSTGTLLRSEHIRRAEYYPKNSLDNYGCHFGGPEMRDCPFLFIQTEAGSERVSGAESASDANRLEEAGVRVIRHLVEPLDPPL